MSSREINAVVLTACKKTLALACIQMFMDRIDSKLVE